MKELTGTGTLIRLILRRDRIWLPIWVLLPMLIASSQVSFVMALPDLWGFIAELNVNPLTGAFLGPVVPMSIAGAVLWRTFPQGALVLAMASLLTVIRHTRTEEAAGRGELMRGGVVGRHAPLTAALTVTCVANLVAGLLTSLVLMGAGMPAGGAFLFGLTVAASGWFFAGVGALSTQLREHAGGARGLGLMVFGLGYLAYAWNNLGGAYTGWAWFSPQGWFRLTRPFAGDHIWALLVLAALCALPAAAAYALSGRRDFGGGLLQPQLGPAEAAPGLRSPLALAWRLHQGALIAWTAGLVFLGVGLGAGVPSVSESVGGMLADMWPDRWAEMVETVGNREAFMAASLYIVALLIGVTVYGITAVVRLRKEETENRAEPLLAEAVSRIEWMSSHLAIAFVGSTFLLLALGLGAGLGWGLVAGDLGVLPRVLGMSLSKIPAVWVMVGLTAMLYGLLPRAASVLSWSFLALFVVMEMAWEAQMVDWSPCTSRRSPMPTTPFPWQSCPSYPCSG